MKTRSQTKKRAVLAPVNNVLTALSIDILGNIVSNLEPENLAALKKTSKGLNTVMKDARLDVVWKSYIDRLNTIMPLDMDPNQNLESQFKSHFKRIDQIQRIEASDLSATSEGQKYSTNITLRRMRKPASSLKTLEERHQFLNQVNLTIINRKLQYSDGNKIDLSYGQITRLPAQMFLHPTVKTVEVLILHSNKIHFLPKEMSMLSNVKVLDLMGNNLRQFPIVICSMQKLELLDLGFNKIESLPEQLSNLVSLNSLSLMSNCLTALPTWIGKLKNLQVLTLGGNRISVLPDELKNCNQIQRLYLADMKLRVLPTYVATYPNLQEVDVSQNKLTEITKEFAALGQVQINARENKIISAPRSANIHVDVSVKTWVPMYQEKNTETLAAHHEEDELNRKRHKRKKK